jgi:D-alanyl-D-alanine carboxypeptidase (penicillin-binding protein 5/6)
MNAYASELGLSNTLFQNAVGWTDPNHFSSARDLANLTQALINNFPHHYATYKEKEFTFSGIRQLNRNGLLWRDDTVDGVKTGHTESAGYCLISSAKRNDMRLIAVVAGSPSESERLTSSQRLLEYGFRFFATQKLITKDSEITAAKVWGGKMDEVALGTNEDILLTLPRSDFKNIKANYKFKNYIQAPVSKGDVIGEVEFISNDLVVLSTPLVAIESVKAKGFFGRIWARIVFWIMSLFSIGQND